MSKRIHFILFPLLLVALLFYSNKGAVDIPNNSQSEYKTHLSFVSYKQATVYGIDKESTHRSKYVIRAKALDNNFALHFPCYPTLCFKKHFFSKPTCGYFIQELYQSPVISNKLRGPPLNA